MTRFTTEYTKAVGLSLRCLLPEVTGNKVIIIGLYKYVC
jgi:hypothetical protein